MKNSQFLRQVKDSGMLKGVSLQVYEIISHNPGLTVGQIEYEYADVCSVIRSRNELAKRVSDLVTWGAVKSTGKVVCPVTGRMAKTWEVTGALPNKDGPTIDKKDRPTGLTVESALLLNWVVTFCAFLTNKWYVPYSVKIKAASVQVAVLEALLRLQR